MNLSPATTLIDVNHPLLNDIDPEKRQMLVDKEFDVMVAELAKPGADIKATLSFSGFLNLLQLSNKIIDKGNELDRLKKAVIYNKDINTLPEVVYTTLPSSQGLAAAFDALDADKLHLLHMAIGLAGEAAEMLEQIVAHVLGAPLDGHNVREEAGDAAFYTVGLLNGIQTHTGEALFANVVKLLGKRYKHGYSDKAAQERADKPAGE
ncbi:MazG-like pyrophosphatase [Pseudomonas phage Lana]|uniref:Toxin-antitoxin protein n=1 Tax=Pseudomonas phage Lana TaxID=2530172 RepID=A0A481W6C1_9CAUD|nr:MazG-like pyrophosphatase [Pseudomonas phage Lana]QBJ04525.1 toxin-antitoxin protein [Pseudomonas phage Lana]